ncbi:MAG: hypothetical protein P8L83_01690 [Flavobacteriaceae bacterium]|nr:hypothetical protein [Flavobacteriaceae bacterium]
MIIFFLQSSISQKVYSQTKNDKKRVKLLLKLSNPKWLKINNKKAFFKHNISSSPSRVSTTSSDQIGRLNSGQSKTQKFLYNKSGYDYDKLENKIIQVALFKPNVQTLEIDLIARCKGNSIDNYDKSNNSFTSFQGLSSVFIDNNQLNQLRKINNKDNFIRNVKVSDQIIMDNLSRIINQICM